MKTDAAERSIPMVPRLYEVLLEHRVEFAYGPNEPVFATRLGTRNTPDNVRARIVAPIHVQANELLEAARLAPIAQLTPHTLRRTFASILAELGVPPRRAMYLLGHRDPKFTMRVYQQVLTWAEAPRTNSRTPSAARVRRRSWCSRDGSFED